jgi:hypothetical protein
MCEPNGTCRLCGSLALVKSLFRCGSSPSAGSSLVGASVNGAPLRPASHEFRRQQLAFLVRQPVGLQEPVECPDPWLALARAYEGAVAAQHVRLRRR